jgi:DNA-binding beta-propeller fold protein YncE
MYRAIAENGVYAAFRDVSTGGGGIAVIDGATDSISASISDPTTSIPEGIAVDSASDIIYVANGSTVLVINGATNAITATVSTGGCYLAAFDQATDVVYVASGATVRAIDGATDTVTATVSIGSARATGIAVDPDTNTVYVADKRAQRRGGDRRRHRHRDRDRAHGP